MKTKDDQGNVIEDQYVAPANKNSKDSQAELLIKLLKDSTTYFHTPDGDAFASIMVNDHIENIRIRSQYFRQWLGRLYFKQTKKPAGAQAIKDTMDILEAEGKFDGAEIPLNLRYAWHIDSIYIDLCNANWDQVQILKNQWKVIESKKSPVKF